MGQCSARLTRGRMMHLRMPARLEGDDVAKRLRAAISAASVGNHGQASRAKAERQSETTSVNRVSAGGPAK